jgi:hypothetical protein
MKKIYVLLLILLSIAFIFLYYRAVKNNPTVHSDGTIEYNFTKQSQANASRKLYKYVLKDLNKSEKEIQSFARITPKTISAFEADLNGDDKKEIIGVVFSTLYMGSTGYSLFILEEKNNDLDDIVYQINFEPIKQFYILPNKTNGYKDIKIYGSSAYNFEPMVIRYNKHFYYNTKQDILFKNK